MHDHRWGYEHSDTWVILLSRGKFHLLTLLAVCFQHHMHVREYSRCPFILQGGRFSQIRSHIICNGWQGLYNQGSSQRRRCWTKHSSVHGWTKAVATTRDWNWKRSNHYIYMLREQSVEWSYALSWNAQSQFHWLVLQTRSYNCVPFWLISSRFWSHSKMLQVVMWIPTLSSSDSEYYNTDCSDSEVESGCSPFASNS